MTYQLKPYPTTDLYDAHMESVKYCLLPFMDFGRHQQFAGRIRTLVTVEDTLLAQSLFRQPGDGAIAVIDGGGSLRTAMLGDINAAILEKNDWTGIVINGAVRDSQQLTNINIGIKALATTPIKSRKDGIGAIDVPIAFGGVLFTPGDCLYCDADGVILSKTPLSLSTS